MAFGDTRKRHMIYAAALRRKYPTSEIRMITYAPRSASKATEYVRDGFRIYGTGSIHRATYRVGVLRRLPMVFAGGWRPDVVTVQTPWEEGSLGYLIARCLKAKYLAQLHFDVLSAEWKREHWLNPWRLRIASWLLRHSDRIRVVSTAQREKLVEQLSIPADKINVVPVGVHFQPVTGDKSEFKRNIASGLENKKVVLFVGRFYAPKNLSLWVEVSEQVSCQVPDVAFVMAGDGPLFGEIRSVVRRKQMQDRFHFLGSVGHERLPQVYAAADVFLLSSRYEGFGRVIVESYLAGIPVVSTRCGGPEDLIEAGTTGFLLEPDDCQGLSAAIVQLLRDDGLRERFGRLGSKKVASEFNLEVLSERLVALWEQTWLTKRTY